MADRAQRNQGADGLPGTPPNRSPGKSDRLPAVELALGVLLRVRDHD